jgi:cytochrome P450
MDRPMSERVWDTERGDLVAGYAPFDRGIQDDPFPYYVALRDQCPVHHARLPHAELAKINANPLVAQPTNEIWSVARYQDIVAVLSANETFSSRQGPAPERLNLPGEGVLLWADEPIHFPQRKLMRTALVPRMVRAMEGALQEYADGLVDGFAPGGRVDLVDHFASRIPMKMVTRLLGVESGDFDEFRQWSVDAAAGFGGTPDSYERSAIAFGNIITYFFGQIAQRRQLLEAGGPLSDDLVSSMMTAEFDGRVLTDEEIAWVGFQLLVAGNDTTTNAISNAVVMLCTHPGQRAQLLADPALLPTAVEEVLRFLPPMHGLFRTANADTIVAGCPVPANAKIRTLYASGNRDESVWDRPDEFVIDRELGAVRKHLSFGFGVHSCLGAPLARMEITVAVRTLLDRLPGFELDPDNPPTRSPSFIAHGHETVTAVWHTAAVRPADRPGRWWHTAADEAG